MADGYIVQRLLTRIPVKKSLILPDLSSALPEDCRTFAAFGQLPSCAAPLVDHGTWNVHTLLSKDSDIILVRIGRYRRIMCRGRGARDRVHGPCVGLVVWVNIGGGRGRGLLLVLVLLVVVLRRVRIHILGRLGREVRLERRRRPKWPKQMSVATGGCRTARNIRASTADARLRPSSQDPVTGTHVASAGSHHSGFRSGL